MLMERQPSAGFPLQKASQLANFRPLVQHLDLNAFELRRLPIDILWFDVNRAARRRFFGDEALIHF